MGEKKTLIWQEIWVDDRRAGWELLKNGNLNHIPQRDHHARTEIIDAANEPPPEH